MTDLVGKDKIHRMSRFKFSKLFLASTAIQIILIGVTMSEALLAKENIPASYIPREVLFAPKEVLAIKISPDSKHIAYLKADPTGAMNLYLCDIENCKNYDALNAITHFTTPEIYRFFWTGDSKNIIFLKDTNGSKMYDLYGVNVTTKKVVDYTKLFKKISAKIFKVGVSKVAVGINDRNPAYHDVYILDTNNGELTKSFENDKYSRFTFDDNLNIVFKEEIHDDGSIDVYKSDKLFMHLTPEDAFHTYLMQIRDNTLFFLDSRDSDTTWLKSLDLNTGKEAKIAHNDKSDIENVVFVDNQPVMYSTTWLQQEWHALNFAKMSALVKQIGDTFEVVSQSAKYWIIRTTGPKIIGANFFLYNLSNDQLTSLYTAKTDPDLSNMLPFEFKTRDGLNLTAYLTLPKKYNAIKDVKQPIPLIVFPHGGPFQARDTMEYQPFYQWLASRGYAVLAVNFRLSSGLGKNLVNAGNGEWGRKAQYDLIDGVQWCIEHGITTKDRVGIMGGSYGGYATLAALAFSPKDFVVGVDIVGPSSLITVMQKVPKYWDFPSYPASDAELFFTRGAFITSMGGSPDDEKGREFLASRSPLNFVQQIQSPLLIIQGDNDPIVTKEESSQIYAELKRLHKKTCFLSFPDEGHQFRRYANIDVYLAYAEKWLHDYLGGTYEPINQRYLQESSVVVQE